MSADLNENAIRRHIRLMSLSAVGTVALLIIFIFTITQVVQSIFDSSYKAQIKAYANEFSLAVKKQSSGDITMLMTLAQFIHNESDLTDRYVRTRQNSNDFELIGFWDINGASSQISLSGIQTFSHFNNLPPEMQQAIIAAWSGKYAISQPFHSKRLSQSYIAYASPVLDINGRPVAAISAIKNLNSFDKLLNQLNFNLSNVNLFLIDKHGAVMANSRNIFNITHLDNIRSLRGLSDKMVREITAALKKEHDYSTKFDYYNNSYSLNLSPLNYEGWFTAYIDRPDLQAAPVYSSLQNLVNILLAVLVLLVLGGGTAFFVLRRSYLQQLVLAFYDPLTESCNSRKFSIELDSLLERHQAEGFSVALIKVRDFHFISDYLGTPNCNALLKLISKQLHYCPNVILAARAQDEHFYLLLNLYAKQQIQDTLLELFNTMAREFNRHMSSFPLVFSAGVVQAQNDDNASGLLHKCEFALQAIPKSYTHALRFYDDNSYQSEMRIKEIELDMRPALEQGEFKLFLQPKFDLQNGRITAAEALVRWVKPDGRIIFPGDFIPLFENNGFCAELDLYIFEQVCRTIRRWLNEGKKPIKISVNQSKQLIFRQNYIELVQQLIQKYQIPPHHIVIEILESIMAQDVLELNGYIKKLRSIGLLISMDDFGSGYSSLNLLSGLDVDEIKFDKEFLLEADTAKKEKNKLILTHLLSLAQQFNAQTVVEGVEKAEDVSFLKAQGCTLAQGYYFNKPIALSAFDELYMQSA